MNQPEVDTDSAKQTFSNFLEEHYRDEIGALDSDYPSRLTLIYDWGDLVSFDLQLAKDYRADPDEYQQAFDEALRFHDVHDAAYLNYLKAIPRNVGEPVDPSEIFHARHHVSTIIGRITELEDTENLFHAGVYVCQGCDETNIQTRQPRQEVKEPFQCRGCGRRRVEYEIDYKRSEVLPRVIGMVEGPRQVVSLGDTQQEELVVLGEYANIIEPGQWYAFTGKTRVKLRNDGTSIVDPYYEAWHAEPIDPSEYLDDIEDDETLEVTTVLQSADVDLDPKHLTGFTTHTEQVFESTPPETMNETETKMKLLTPFLGLLGWELYDEEVRMEYTTNIGDADYVLGGDDPFFVVEAKSANSLTWSDTEQIEKYMWYSEATHGLLTDGVAYKFLVRSMDSMTASVVASCRYEHLEEFHEEIAKFTRAALLE